MSDAKRYSPCPKCCGAQIERHDGAPCPDCGHGDCAPGVVDAGALAVQIARTLPTPDEPCAWCESPTDCQCARCDFCDKEPCECPDEYPDGEAPGEGMGER